MKFILVTGSAGFLGRHVMSLLSRNGYSPIGLDNSEPHCGAQVSGPVLETDITDFDSLQNLIIDFDIDTIIHLAAYGRNLSCQDFPQRAWEVNVDGTHNILEIARQNPKTVKRVVVCSSNITLSDQPTTYKMTKLMCEHLVEQYAKMGVSVMGIRPSNIYGEGQSKTEYQPCAFAGLDNSYARDGHFTITGDGTQARDWVHARDVARAFYLAAASEVAGVTVDVCSGILTSMNDVASLVGVPVQYTDPRPGDAKVLISNPDPAWSLLNYRARIALKDAIFDGFPSVPRGTL